MSQIWRGPKVEPVLVPMRPIWVEDHRWYAVGCIEARLGQELLDTGIETRLVTVMEV